MWELREKIEGYCVRTNTKTENHCVAGRKVGEAGILEAQLVPCTSHFAFPPNMPH